MNTREKELDFDGFDRYCKNVAIPTTSISHYKSYLRDGLNVLLQTERYSNRNVEEVLDDFLKHKQNDANFLKEEFEKIRNQNDKYKNKTDLYSGFTAALKKYRDFLEKKYPMSKEELEKKYDTIIQSLISGPIILKTVTGAKFKLKANSNKSFYVSALNGETDMSVSKEKLMRVLYENEAYTYTSYEPVIIQYLFGLIEPEKEGIKNMIEEPSNKSYPLKNIIFYGPPGTGKTYHTINKALEIIYNCDCDKEGLDKYIDEDQNIDSEIKRLKNKREKYKKVFEYYKAQGQIKFVTFHQSYGYEEFIEGLKAKTVNKQIEYKVEDGIFKKLCKKASLKAEIEQNIELDDPNQTVWKMSLGEAGTEKAKQIREYCFENNIIALGFCVSNIKFEGKNSSEILEEMKKINKNCKEEDANKTSRFINELKENDIVLIAGDDLKTITGIAKVKHTYNVLSNNCPDFMKGYEQFREVEWLAKNIDLKVDDLLYEGKQRLGRGTLIKNNTIDIKKLFNAEKNYVLIIDEINRGNISKIFGELITLIEEDKRLGADEAMKVALPYSGDHSEPFGVPSNLYIIGTMNTADRSIALMDTALRRRFVFEEMMPYPELLGKIEVAKDKDREMIDLKEMLKTINDRIEYLYDRDHTIGHAYFMGLEKVRDEKRFDELGQVFKNRIIPLLQEYFYDDWEKIRLMLGDNQKDEDFRFIQVSKEKNAKDLFGNIESEGFDGMINEEKKIYTLNEKAFKKSESYIGIYDPERARKTGQTSDNETKQP
ncbi:AAA family ATPase [Hydrogenimonas cancrithermarum]|uniref:ATPase dynein-related AAA domain-containing protein n=1 Tax=Hydrogenimonas cancrithermarum TaxID=2993563 RepID=A0ABM8FND4_9BACT|nr:AAA family ATPase [Hydrogenimonas cancrithermarum]BDY13884.1 hypothetical protein HCR_21960 [Hydrogenimonas cancrithermarum]